MSSVADSCQICHKEKFKYTCPKCNITYCSVTCYKSPAHLKCSEDFYKSCIQEELTTTEPNSRESMRKMYDILKRIRESDAGIEPNDFEDGLDEPLDSDEGEEEGGDGGEDSDDIDLEENEAENEEDIAVRLQNIDINDADEVWERLTDAERKEFQRMIECGDIMKLLPDYKPWWCKRKVSKIVVLPDKSNKTSTTEESAIPKIKENIQKFSNICQKTPSPCLHYNLWNILTAYACTVRFFNGEQLVSSGEAAAHLVNLSSTLKYGTNFEDADDAIISVEMEALTTGNSTLAEGVASSSTSNTKTLLVESREQLQNDVRELMSNHYYKLAALSDILQLFQLAKQEMKRAKLEHAEFQKLYALCSGSIVLDKAKLLQLAKKMEFLLSYVNREDLK